VGEAIAAMKRTFAIGTAIAVMLALMRLAGDYGYWMRYTAAMRGGETARPHLPRPRMRVAGNAAGLPIATPEAENLLPAALQDAGQQARSQGIQAMVVHRHGHRVFAHFADGRDGDSLLDGGELAALPFALAVGVLADHGRVSFASALQAVRDAVPADAGWRNPWSRAARERLSLHPAPALLLQDADGDVARTLSQRVWLPLRAADAWLWGRDDQAVRVDCCMVARLDDWMRLGDLLLGAGSYEGERIASPDWIRLLLAHDAQGVVHPAWLAARQPWSGDEPPVERDAYWFDLGRDARMWLAPRRGLQILVWAPGGKARDTLIPNIILRGLNDQAPAISGGGVQDLVPGH
jgi:hypothetical protein